MASHTPGKWQRGHPEPCKGLAIDLDIWANDPPQQIAVVCEIGPLGGPDISGANARLIASAPDLLAALEAAEELLAPSASQAKHGGNFALFAAITERLHLIRAAIRAARGE